MFYAVNLEVRATGDDVNSTCLHCHSTEKAAQRCAKSRGEKWQVMSLQEIEAWDKEQSR